MISGRKSFSVVRFTALTLFTVSALVPAPLYAEESPIAIAKDASTPVVSYQQGAAGPAAPGSKVPSGAVSLMEDSALKSSGNSQAGTAFSKPKPPLPPRGRVGNGGNRPPSDPNGTVEDPTNPNGEPNTNCPAGTMPDGSCRKVHQPPKGQSPNVSIHNPHI